MIADFHIHTPLCKHAGGTPEAYVARAKSLGLKKICLTDHAPAPDGYDPTNRMEIGSFPEYRRIFDEVSASSQIPVLWGVEADYYRGNDGFLEQWLPEQDFDFVLGSIHYIGTWGFDNPDEISTWKAAAGEKVEQFWREYFALVSEMAGTGLYDAIAHIDLPKKFSYRPPEQRIPDIVCPALDSIAEAGMAMEINTSGLRRPVHEIYPSLQILELARERDIPVIFGSDAHQPRDVGADFVRAIKLARDAGYTEYVTYEGREMKSEALPALGKSSG